MASGYIGKISAVVTANTSLLSRELVKSAKDANRFANSLKNSIDRGADAASASIEKIFTPLQMLERKLKLAESRGLKLNMPSEQIRAFVSASEQINKPLEQASKQFSKLGLDVQGAFLPALNAAQDAAIRVNREIQQTGAASEGAFTRAQAAVEATTLSLSRLAQAEALVGKGMTGNELQFRSPALFQALQSSAKSTQAAAGLSPQQLADGVIAGRVRELQAYQKEALEAQALLESLELQPNIDPSVIEAQRKRVEELSETTRRASENVLTGLSSSTTPGGEALADNLKEQNRLRQEAIEKGTELLNVFSREEAAQIRLSEQVRKANLNSRISRQEKAERIRSDVLSDEKFALDLDNREIDAYLQKVGVLKTVISGLGSGDTKAAESAIRRLGEAAAIAFDDENIRTEDVKRELNQVEREAVEAAAAVSGIPAEELGRRLNTAGDVGRRGADKFSLAINQAAFAIDDFFSATGGFEFKLRAVQNNLTQLGFIIGETKGLFIALGAAIAGQAAVALARYVNGGASAQQTSKALNESLKEQQTIVDQLRQKFDQLGESIASAAFSGSPDDQFRRQLDELEKQAREAREATVAAISPDVVRERVQQERLREQQGAATSIGQVLAIEAQIQESRRRQAEAEAEAARAPVAASNARDQVIGTIRANEFLQGGRLTGVSLRRAEEERQRFAEIFEDAGNDITSIIDAVEERLGQRRDVAAESIGATNFERAPEILRARRDQAELEAVLRRLRLIEQSGADTAALSALAAARRVGGTIQSSRQSLVDGGASDGFLSEALSRVADSLNTRLQRLGEARAAGDLELVASLESSIEGLQSYASELSSAANATQVFAETLSRVATDLANTAASEAQSAADQARRDRNAVNVDPRSTFDQRQIAERRRRDAAVAADFARQFAANLEADRVSAVQQFDRDAAAGNLGVVVQALVDERRRLEEELNADGTSVERRQQIRARQSQIDAQLSAEFEASPEGRALRDRADAIDRSLINQRRELESAARGEDLIASNAEKAGAQLARNLLDIREAFDLRRRAGVDDDANEQAQAEARLIKESRRQIAPAVFALQDQITNAAIGGPNRAALSASDITTQQGTSELNRLLRGDDPAREQNIVELRKQTAELVGLREDLKNLGVAD